jgi:hypothetical protein
LGFSSPLFSQVCHGSVNLVFVVKEPAFCFVGSLYVFFCLFVSVSLILALIFIISLLLLFWDLLILVFLGA